MDVSIIIVNWNTESYLRNCLRSVFDATTGIEFEVIVIDNASSDRSVVMVESGFPQVRLVKNSDNKGFAAANNQGMGLACGRYVLLLNSDTVVLGDAIGATARFADDHADAAVVGCRVLNADRSLQRTCFMYPSLLNMLLSSSYLYKVFPRSRFFGRERMTWWDRTDTRDVEVVTGCYMLVRRESIDQVAFMDESFHMYGEETDWCYRFKQAGWKVLYTPVGEIVHFGGASSGQVREKMALQLKGSILLFLKKHRGWGVYAVACLLTSLFFLIRTPYWLIVAAVSKRTRRVAMDKARLCVKGVSRSLAGWRALSVNGR
ncbi:MAG: glycosyltransferase family 2 protein [Phycisphaerales bacterium]|nr:MAG: glycosyltransferase family 2 protein [Phycisphaerales bacterium]